MNRRKFIKTAGIGSVVATGISAPAIAQDVPVLKWKCISNFPKSFDLILSTAEEFAKRVSIATGGKFIIEISPADAKTQGAKTIDAVMDGSVEMCHSFSSHKSSKDPSWAFGTGLPHGMNARQTNAWWYQGGGRELVNEFLATQGVYGLAAGNTGAQMGGWFRKEIATLADIKGLKFRIDGFGGKVLEKLGMAVQDIADGEIYSALEKGSIDGAELIGPYDDGKIGFQNVAPFYYYPGFWEGGPMLSFLVNLDKWNSLPDDYKAIFEAASAEVNQSLLAKYDAKNPNALKELVGGGAQIKKFPDEIMSASMKAAKEIYADTSTKNATFKKIHDSYFAFKSDAYLWASVAELGFDIFQAQNRDK